MSTTFERETAPVTKVPPLSEPPKEAQILELAADILDTEGWVRGNFVAWGNRCAVGGIGAAVNRLSFMPGEKAKARREAERVLAELVRPELRDGWPRDDKDAIISWNDHVATGRVSVTRRMREAAASLMRK